MKRVVIADDEVHVRTLLKYLIHWEELGLILQAEFDNGDDIITYARSEQVDIIVTDIMMPGKNGIEMIREMKEIRPKCRFVIISGYRDFDFAQQAVKLGVSDYILKPLNEDEVNAVLKTLAAQETDDDGQASLRSEKRRRFREVLNGERVITTCRQAREQYGMLFEEDGSFRVLVLGFCNVSDADGIDGPAQELLEKIKSAVGEFCTDQEVCRRSPLRFQIVVQIRKDQDAAFLRAAHTVYYDLANARREEMQAHFYLGIGKSVHSFSELKHSAESAELFLSGRLAWGMKRVYVADLLPQSERLLAENMQLSADTLHRFEQSLEGMSEYGVRQSIRSLFSAFRQKNEQNYMQYFYMVHELGRHLCTVLSRLDVHPQEVAQLEGKLAQAADNCDTFSSLQAVTEEFCIDAMNKYLAERVNQESSYVQFARQYIDSHYQEDVSLNLIAQKAHVNAAYLSRIFKESTGMNYSAYLTSVRMEKAKELLKDLDLNLSQIAGRVGYSGTRYFSRAFEQEVGMKPSDYRRAYLRELRK